MIKIVVLVLAFTLLSTNIYEQESNVITEYELDSIESYKTEVRINEIKQSEFSEKLLVELLSLYNVPYKRYIIKQAILETGNFTSVIFMESHNLLGMKHPRVRPTTSIGTNRGHASYLHWTDSVIDYLLWLEYFKNRGWDTDDYFQFLRDVGYAEDPYYIYKLQNLNFV